MGDVAVTDGARRSEGATHPNMIFIPGGTFRMGSDKHYPEEAPVHRVAVGGFWIDRTPVTNRQFKDFVTTIGSFNSRYNLRTDPFERATITSNTYYDWELDHAFMLMPAQALVGQFLATFKDYPPRQKAASFTIQQILEKMSQPSGD